MPNIKSNNKVITISTAILALCALITLGILLFNQLEKTDPGKTDPKKTEQPTSSSIVDKIDNSSSSEPQISKAKKQIMHYDTIQVYIPSKLKVKQVLLDGKLVDFSNKSPIILTLAIDQKSTNQKLTLNCNSFICNLNLDFKNKKKYSITLQENCQIVNYEN